MLGGIDKTREVVLMLASPFRVGKPVWGVVLGTAIALLVALALGAAFPPTASAKAYGCPSGQTGTYKFVATHTAGGGDAGLLAEFSVLDQQGFPHPSLVDGTLTKATPNTLQFEVTSEGTLYAAFLNFTGNTPDYQLHVAGFHCQDS